MAKGQTTMSVTKRLREVVLQDLEQVRQAYVAEEQARPGSADRELHKTAKSDPYKGRTLRSWTMTINNPDARHWAALAKEKCTYQVGVWEEGKQGDSSSGHHLHVALAYQNKVVCPYKRYPGANIQPPIKPFNTWCMYVLKCDETLRGGPWVLPDIEAVTSQGQRSDMEHAAQSILEGDLSFRDIARANPSLFARAGRGLRDLASVTAPHREAAPDHIQCFTRADAKYAVRHMHQQRHQIYWKPVKGGWPGYEPMFHQTVVMKFPKDKDELADLLDDCPTYVKVGADNVPFRATTIISFCVNTEGEQHDDHSAELNYDQREMTTAARKIHQRRTADGTLVPVV